MIPPLLDLKWLPLLLVPALLLIPARATEDVQVTQAPPQVRKEFVGPTLVPNATPPAQRRYRQPADAYLLAYRDASRLPPDLACNVFYFWHSEGDATTARTRFIAVSGLVNALSQSQRIVPAAIILEDGTTLPWQLMRPQNWARVVLFRVCICDYNQPRSQFEKLGDPNLEHLFRTFTLRKWEAGNYGGTYYPAGEVKKAITAPWVFEPLGMPEGQGAEPARQRMEATYAEAGIGLRALTHSSVPIVEARNFVWQTAINFLRPAGYYSWFGKDGIKNVDDWDRIIRRVKGSIVLRDAVSHSGVAKQSREVEREGRGDGRWITRDQVDHFAQGIRNPLVIRQRGVLRFDGIEGFGRMDNGWWAVIAANNDGKKGGTALDSAPDGIGYNHGAKSNRGAIDVCLTCFGCHDKAPGNGGLQPFAAYNRTKYSEPGKLGAVFLDKQTEFEYLTPFDPWADTDRRTYINAVMQATGVEPHVWAAALVDTFNSWDQPLGIDQAAMELGVKPEAWIAALDEYLTIWGALPDPINDNWSKPPAQRTKITRESWAEFYPYAQLILRGLPVDYVWPAHLVPPKHKGKPQR